MEKKKTKKKWREIRSAITMMCVMAAMLSTATYAWFTLTDSPTVTGLEMTAVSSGGLQISKNGTTWYNAIDLSDGIDVAALEKFELMPATIANTDLAAGKPTFYAPTYSGNTVTGTTAIAEGDLGKYVAKCTYYLQPDEGTVKVGIISVDQDEIDGENIGVDGGNAKQPGSFVKVTEAPDGDSETDQTAVESVRIAFVVNGNMYVYEPNYSAAAAAAGSTFATNNVGDPITPTVRSNYDDGVMTIGNGTDNYTSIGLFDVTGKTQVEMYLWFEGKDPHCVDQIISDVITAQIQFTVVPTT